VCCVRACNYSEFRRDDTNMLIFTHGYEYVRQKV
jgi:hypothetical protein